MSIEGAAASGAAKLAVAGAGQFSPRRWPQWTASQVVIKWPLISVHHNCAKAPPGLPAGQHAHVAAIKVENRTDHLVFDPKVVVVFLNTAVDPGHKHPHTEVSAERQKAIQPGETWTVDLERGGRDVFLCPTPSEPPIAVHLEYTVDGRRRARQYDCRPHRLDGAVAGWRQRRKWKWLRGRASEPQPVRATT